MVKSCKFFFFDILNGFHKTFSFSGDDTWHLYNILLSCFYIILILRNYQWNGFVEERDTIPFLKIQYVLKREYVFLQIKKNLYLFSSTAIFVFLQNYNPVLIRDHFAPNKNVKIDTHDIIILFAEVYNYFIFSSNHYYDANFIK